MESKRIKWFRSKVGKCSFYFWNQFRISVYSTTLQKSPPWKLKSSQKSGKSQNRPQGGDFAPIEDHWSRGINCCIQT